MEKVKSKHFQYTGLDDYDKSLDDQMLVGSSASELITWRERPIASALRRGREECCLPRSNAAWLRCSALCGSPKMMRSPV